jgi:predicted TIM-barrel fold metal-dependent hydrolase
MVESRLFPKPEGPGRAPRAILSPKLREIHEERIAASQNPTLRLEKMNSFGISKALLLPSQGFVTGSIMDPDLAAAVAGAYNRWLHEFCSADPERLLGVAIVPLQNVEAAVREVERAAQLKFRGIYVRPNPVAGKTLLDPSYKPIFAACEAHNLPLMVHEGCGFAPDDTVGVTRFENGLFSHMISHPFEVMLSMLALIAGGVLERHPNLRVAFLEAGAGWAPFWLDRMDDHAELLSWEVPWLSMKPSEYFRRQCVVSCDPDEANIDVVLREVGNQNVVVLTDYPHLDYVDAEHVSDFACLKSLNEEQRTAVLSGNAKWFLQMET